MVGVMARRPLSHRILTCHNRESEFSGDHAINISDTIFSFLDEEGSSTESVTDDVYVEDENEEKENVEYNQFWETQRQLLQVSTLLMSKIITFNFHYIISTMFTSQFLLINFIYMLN